MNVTRNDNLSTRPRGPFSGYRRCQPFSSRRGNFSNRGSFEIQRIARTPSRVTPSTSKNSSSNRRNQFSATSSSCHPFSTPSDRRTPRSANSSSTDCNSSCIVALSEGRGQARGEIGIAAVDIHRPHLILCQISDGQTYMNTLTKLHIFNPVEVLVPNTFCDGKTPSKVFLVIREQCPSISIVCVQRRHFNEANGRKLINLLCASEYSSVELLLTHKFYALAAAAALLKYVEYIQNLIFAPKSLKVEYQGSQNTTVIDVDTASRLELVASLFGRVSEGKAWGKRKKLGGGGAEAKPSLLNILNHCYTNGGLRLLRASILQPPCLVTSIETRLESVTELVEKPSLTDAIGSVLGQLSDVEQLLTLCMVSPNGDNASASGDTLLRLAELRINYALLLKTSLAMVPPLLSSLEEASTPHLRGIRKSLIDPRYSEMLEQISEVLHDDARVSKGFASSHLQRCFAVRPGINGLLDVARKTYSEIVGDITTYVVELGEAHNLNLRVNYNATRGFHIQIISLDNRANINETELPKEFIQVQKMGKSLTCVTQELIEYDMRCKVALQEIQTMSNVVILELLGKLREKIGSLYKLCEAVSTLDMLLCLAHVSSFPGFCQPRFDNYLNVVNGRHPLMDFFGSREPVPNSVYASSHFNFHVITGPNMSGKSIYIKMIAMLQIMAQVGCYVPAEKATFRVSDRIFSRIGFDDSIECNASTFVLELKEMQYILQNITDKSLIIIDELCRGTSIEEGTALAWALSEELLASSAFVFLTTHFTFITKLETVYPNVTNHHLRTDVQEVRESQMDSGNPEIARSRLHYTHRLEPGITNVKNYGLKLAQVSGLPPSIISASLRIYGDLSKGIKPLPAVEGEAEIEYKAHRIVGELMRLSDELSDSKSAGDDNLATKKKTFSEYQKLAQQAAQFNFSHYFMNDSSGLPSRVGVLAENQNIPEGESRAMEVETTEDGDISENQPEVESNLSPYHGDAIRGNELIRYPIGSPNHIEPSEITEPVFVECDVVIEE